MYHDIREIYWLNGMKKDIAEFVAQCPNCQKVKVEHQKPGRLLRDIKIPTWKREAINMNFVIVLPRSQCSYRYSIQMVLYESLYGRKLRSPIGWFEFRESRLIWLDLVQQALEKVKLIQERLLAAQRS
ncbi:uncharacterized protein LOC132637642 [Lycium barbarum]|uniref:uncharacterized protein LOC132637642 n=1 Tax=Lycium barbarum TaxID=112863 RepID=UPI00293EB861|nr:uncharacterized protein LOC132637642 [Lycium barbarum]